jgi:hypothetical protein
MLRHAHLIGVARVLGASIVKIMLVLVIPKGFPLVLIIELGLIEILMVPQLIGKALIKVFVIELRCWHMLELLCLINAAHGQARDLLGVAESVYQLLGIHGLKGYARGLPVQFVTLIFLKLAQCSLVGFGSFLITG